jgi:hypothetical protein
MGSSLRPAPNQPSPQKAHRRRQQLDWGRCGVCLLPSLSPNGWPHRTRCGESKAASALSVAGYPQNDRDDRIGHRGDRLGDHVEIEPHLRADYRQNEQYPDQDHHPVRLQSGKRGSERFWEHSHRDPSTVEWRQWQQIEVSAFFKFSTSIAQLSQEGSRQGRTSSRRAMRARYSCSGRRPRPAPYRAADCAAPGS